MSVTVTSLKSLGAWVAVTLAGTAIPWPEIEIGRLDGFNFYTSPYMPYQWRRLQINRQTRHKFAVRGSGARSQKRRKIKIMRGRIMSPPLKSDPSQLYSIEALDELLR